MKRFDFANFPPALFIGSIFFTLVLAIATNVIRNDSMPAELIDAEIDAQTGALLTETGSIAEEDDHQLTPEERYTRINGFILRVDNRFEKIQSQRSAEQLRRQDDIQNQILCRNDIRQSNRDTKLPTLFRCYRGALTLDLETLRKERTNLVDITGATEEVREATLATINPLMDAIATVIDAIDAGVYESEEDLKEAKRNLTERYWTLKWMASTKLRADEMLTWTVFLMSETAPLILRDDITEVEQEIYTNAYACLESAELRLTEVLDTQELNTASEKMDAALGGITDCLDILVDNLPPPESFDITSPAEEEEKELLILPRRLLRRGLY
ncbi:hypothetical protein KKF55_05105 [Patescibacteria group bacterium]|nr:hypothetical protein [Patescibacteria group bacterium]